MNNIKIRRQVECKSPSLSESTSIFNMELSHLGSKAYSLKDTDLIIFLST